MTDCHIDITSNHSLFYVCKTIFIIVFVKYFFLVTLLFATVHLTRISLFFPRISLNLIFLVVLVFIFIFYYFCNFGLIGTAYTDAFERFLVANTFEVDYNEVILLQGSRVIACFNFCYDKMSRCQNVSILRHVLLLRYALCDKQPNRDRMVAVADDIHAAAPM